MYKIGCLSYRFGFKEQVTVMTITQRSMRDGSQCRAFAGNRLPQWGLKNIARLLFCLCHRNNPAVFSATDAKMHGSRAQSLTIARMGNKNPYPSRKR